MAGGRGTAGTHTYEFRYLPWDVPLGLILFGIGSAYACGCGEIL